MGRHVFLEVDGSFKLFLAQFAFEHINRLVDVSHVSLHSLLAEKDLVADFALYRIRLDVQFFVYFKGFFVLALPLANVTF